MRTLNVKENGSFRTLTRVKPADSFYMYEILISLCINCTELNNNNYNNYNNNSNNDNNGNNSFG